MSLADRTRQEAVPYALAALESLVRIPSVGADPARAGRVNESATAVAALLRDVGCPDVRVVSAGGGAPAVIGRFAAPPGMPTICRYAHHDVQPEGDPADWSTRPFEPTVRAGRLYGRGAADDKGGLAVHLAALRAFDGRPPVGVTVLVEGEEEIGSPTLGALLADHAAELAADVYVIADSTNWSAGEPAFTTSLRGLVSCLVEVRTLEHGVHSGVFGGPVPDALTALCRLLATLHDAAGDVAVPGLHHAAAPDLDYPPARLRRESSLLEGVEWTGTGSLAARLWSRPALAVLAIEAQPLAQASNTLQPSARALVSMRIPPGQDPREALDLLSVHLQRAAPWGAQVRVSEPELAAATAVAFAGPVAAAALEAFREAWGKDPVFIGQGGTIPLVAEFQRAAPAATILITAVADPESRAHGVDESLDLGDFTCACVAEVLMLDRCARLASPL